MIGYALVMVASGENTVSLVPFIIPLEDKTLMAYCISADFLLMSLKSFLFSLVVFVPDVFILALTLFMAGLCLPPFT